MTFDTVKFEKTDIMRELRFLAFYILAGAVIYFTMMARGLFNHYDGLWHISVYYAGDWEVTIGRWFWPLIDRLRFGVVSSPLNTLLSLVLTGMGHILIFRLFDVDRIWKKILYSILWIASPVFCISLSYTYMSVTFAAAFFFAASGAFALIRAGGWKSIVFSACLFAVSMGCYQAYTGVFCLVLAVWLIVLGKREEEFREIGLFIGKTAASILAGGVIYLIMVKISLNVRDLTMDDYGGASGITAGAVLRNLPSGLKQCYREFFRYFGSSAIHNNHFKENHAAVLLFAVLFAVMLVRTVKVFRKSAGHGAAMVLGAVLIPAAANFVLLLPVDSSVKLQMCPGMAMVPGVLLCLADRTASPGKKTRFPAAAAAVAASLLVWVSILSTTNDQIAMDEGRTAVTTIAQSVWADLREADVIGSGRKFCTIGIPGMNPRFFQYDGWKKANTFARYGMWSTAPGCDFYSWRSTFKYTCGVMPEFCSTDEYKQLAGSPAVAAMPVYPEKGSIREINGIVVIKISDTY